MSTSGSRGSGGESTSEYPESLEPIPLNREGREETRRLNLFWRRAQRRREYGSLDPCPGSHRKGQVKTGPSQRPKKAMPRAGAQPMRQRGCSGLKAATLRRRRRQPGQSGTWTGLPTSPTRHVVPIGTHVRRPPQSMPDGIAAAKTSYIRSLSVLPLRHLFLSVSVREARCRASLALGRRLLMKDLRTEFARHERAS